MYYFKSTNSIVKKYEYFSRDALTEKVYPVVFDAVRAQILKFEREQFYSEPDKPWGVALERGDLPAALGLIQQLVDENAGDYEFLKSKGVEFIRCRPLKFPATDYIKWEVQVYRRTSEVYENIYWCLYIQLDEVFDKYALNDFMIFDARFAVVQDYDRNGLLMGGWLVDKVDDILALLSLFAFIKANCLPLKLLESQKLDI